MKLESVAALGADAQRQIAAKLGGSVRALRPVGKHGRAKPTTLDGIRFRSQCEARVYLRLKDELCVGQKLVIDCRFALIASASRIGKAAKAGYITIDFTIWRYGTFVECSAWVLYRAIDAKPKSAKAKSRDWRRGARAFHATTGIEIEEVSE